MPPPVKLPSKLPPRYGNNNNVSNPSIIGNPPPPQFVRPQQNLEDTPNVVVSGTVINTTAPPQTVPPNPLQPQEIINNNSVTGGTAASRPSSVTNTPNISPIAPKNLPPQFSDGNNNNNNNNASSRSGSNSIRPPPPNHKPPSRSNSADQNNESSFQQVKKAPPLPPMVIPRTSTNSNPSSRNGTPTGEDGLLENRGPITTRPAPQTQQDQQQPPKPQGSTSRQSTPNSRVPSAPPLARASKPQQQEQGQQPITETIIVSDDAVVPQQQQVPTVNNNTAAMAIKRPPPQSPPQSPPAPTFVVPPQKQPPTSPAILTPPTANNNNNKNSYEKTDPLQVPQSSSQPQSLPPRKSSSTSRQGSRNQSPDPFSRLGQDSIRNQQQQIPRSNPGTTSNNNNNKQINNTSLLPPPSPQNQNDGPSLAPPQTNSNNINNNNLQRSDSIRTSISSQQQQVPQHGCINPPTVRKLYKTTSSQTEIVWDELVKKLAQPAVYVVSSQEVATQLTRLLAKDPKSIERNRHEENDSNNNLVSPSKLMSGSLVQFQQQQQVEEENNRNNNKRSIVIRESNSNVNESFRSTYNMLPRVVAEVTEKTVLRPIESKRFASGNSSSLVFGHSTAYIAEKEKLFSVPDDRAYSNKMAEKVHQFSPNGQQNRSLYISQTENYFGGVSFENSEIRARNLAMHEAEMKRRNQVKENLDLISGNSRTASSVVTYPEKHTNISNNTSSTRFGQHLQQQQSLFADPSPFFASNSPTRKFEDTKTRAKDPLHSVVAMEEL
jgi:hypothetical protein